MKMFLVETKEKKYTCVLKDRIHIQNIMINQENYILFLEGQEGGK